MKNSSRFVPAILCLALLLLFSALSFVKAKEPHTETGHSDLAANLKSAYLSEKAGQNSNFCNRTKEEVPEAIYNTTNEKISELNIRILTGKEVSSAERDLMAAYPAVQLDEQTNRLVVCFSQESNDKELPEEEYLAVCRKLFEQVIGVYEVDEYCLVPEKELLFDTFSSSVKAGRGIFVVTAVNGNQITYSTASLGFRAKYVSSGVTHWGFVSCGHGTAMNEEVFLTTAFNSNVYFGKVIAIKNQGIVDASFIELQNNNYTLSLDINSTYATLDGLGTTPAAGTELYKVGQTTNYTHGTIFNMYGNGYFDSVYHYNLIKVSGGIADFGDSGGIAYVTRSNSLTSAGIVLGGDTSWTWTYFIRYSSIISELGVTSY